MVICVGSFLAWYGLWHLWVAYLKFSTAYESKEGNSLKKSIEWLLPYFTGEKKHAEWVNSKSAFDKKRADNGEKGYIAGTLFKPSSAGTSVALAGYFDSSMLSIYQQEAKTESKYPTWQFVLNEIKR